MQVIPAKAAGKSHNHIVIPFPALHSPSLHACLDNGKLGSGDIEGINISS